VNNVIAIIVAHNPEIRRFKHVVRAASRQVSKVITVDNNSTNRDSIESLCNDVGNCELIELKFNAGIAYALKVGVHYAIEKYNPEWLLFLDDDAILLTDALNKAFNIIKNLKPSIYRKTGAVLLGFSGAGDCSIKEIVYGRFSGTLIKANVVVKSCCREDFFLDHSDFDMYARIRELGFLTLIISCKLVDQELGQMRYIKVLSTVFHGPLDYEPPWRYYYIVRNGTILFMEGRMDFRTYIDQLTYWGIRVLFADGVKAF